MSWQGIAFSRRINEQVNPAGFDKEIELLLRQTGTTNDIGEKVDKYVSHVCHRGMMLKLADSKEQLVDVNQGLEEMVFCLVWYHECYLNVQNRVKIDGQVYNILMADEWPDRKKYVRLRLTAWKEA